MTITPDVEVRYFCSSGHVSQSRHLLMTPKTVHIFTLVKAFL